MAPWTFDAGFNPDWQRRLLAQANRIASHQISFFDLQEHNLGSPIDWNRDHKAGKRAPLAFAPTIDYRSFDLTGDCKFVWEPNRHHQLVVLGRAYRVTGDRRYAEAAAEQLESWLEQCPFGIGMNWRSPLELGIRLINWTWAFDLLRETGVFQGAPRSRLLNAVHRHVWEIARKYSRGSSANNHLVGEAAGVYIATSYFHNLKGAQRWREQSREILCHELLSQIHADGGTREQALGYLLFVLQFFLLAAIVAHRSGDGMPAAYRARLEKMLAFIGGLCEGGATPPVFGDCDDGYVLDLGNTPDDYHGWLAAGAVLCDRADLRRQAGAISEPAWWLLGPEAQAQFDTMSNAAGDEHIGSRAFPESGYYLLQHGKRDAADRLSVVFDCGELGYGPLAAHGHADALSFTLRAFGVNVFVDPGTYDYFSYPAWRDYFRSTRAHNTVVIDGQNQSQMLGAFLWGARARARCRAWNPTAAGGQVIGEHDGYKRLDDPVVHRRSLDLDGEARRLTVRDEIHTRGDHRVDICYHLAEHCRVEAAGDNRYLIDAGPGKVVLQFDPRLSVERVSGNTDPIGGWVSRGYHQKVPSTTLVGHCRTRTGIALTSEIAIGSPAVVSHDHESRVCTLG